MNIIEALQDKDNNKAYQFLLELESASAGSNELYGYFDDFLKLLEHKSSFVRVRGFRLCCAQIPWDTAHKFETYIDKLLSMLDDEKPIAVRQYLTSLHLVVLYKPELHAAIEAKLKTLDLSKYKDSMRPLIEKDIEELQEIL